MFSRVLMSSLLLLITFATFSSTGSLPPQAVTTATSLETFTTLVTSTSFGFSAVGTSYSTSTARGTLYSESITIRAPTTTDYCNYRSLPFTAASGQHLSGQLTSSTPLDFYVMTEDAFKKWGGRICTVRDALVKAEGVVKYSIDLVIPNDGEYEFLFETFSTNAPTEIQFDVGTGPTATVTSALTIYSTATQAYVLTSTAPSTRLYTLEAAEPLSFGGNGLLIAALVGMLLIAGAFFAYRKRARKKATVEARTEAADFCINCGAELSPRAKFCRKCGAESSKT